MNARTKSAARQAANQSEGNEPVAVALQNEAEVPTAPKPKEEAAPVTDETCLNPDCKVVISEKSKNKYGRHGDRWTCCQVCDDIVDPVSAAIRIRRSGRGTPLIEGVDQREQVNQIQAEF